MIKAKDIIKSYGNGESRFQVLKGISLDIEDNKKACAAAFERQPADRFQNAEPQSRKKQRIALRGGLEKEYPEIEKGPCILHCFCFILFFIYDTDVVQYERFRK